MKSKDLLRKSMGMVASLAMELAILTANSTCCWWSYQPKTPEGLKKNDSSDCGKMG